MSDVFVSYKAEDRRRVEPLIHSLEADGLSVWWDAQIGGGERWRESILKNLEAAAAVIVVWSKRSVGTDGEFVRDEASRAKRLGTYLPVRIDNVDPPLGFGEMQAISLQGWKGSREDRRYQSVIAAVRSHQGLWRPGREPEPAAYALTRRTALFGGAGAAALTAAGVGAWWYSRPAAASNSIAVLPFANLSGDPAQAYFSDGIAEELRSALSRISGLKVVARTSSEAVRDQDAKTAAHKLDVSNILTGSVRRSASVIRVSTQLIDAREGTERWSDDYDRPVGDALQIQSDIARRVAAALALQFAPAARGSIVAGGTSNPEAHDLFLKGLAVRQGTHSEQTMRGAIGLFDAAIKLDPGYADAYARKASALCELASAFSKSETEMRLRYDQAAATANHALALSPDLPSAHAALAAVSRDRLDFARALTEFRKAASANSSDTAILGEYGRLLGELGMSDEALRIGTRLVTLDPLNARSYSVEAVTRYYARQWSDSALIAGKNHMLAPEAVAPLDGLGDAMLLMGKYQEARAAFAQMPVDDLFRITSEGILDERTGNHAASAEAVNKLERMFGGAASYQLVQLHAQRGERDAAFASLERALRVRDPGLVALLTDPFLDPIRRDARFGIFKSKINFPAGSGGRQF